MLAKINILAEVNIRDQFQKNFSTGIPGSLGDVVSNILPQIYVLALILVLVYLTWGAYRYMMSGGDPKATQAARAHLTWAIIGMVIIALSYGMFQLVNSLLNNAFTN